MIDWFHLPPRSVQAMCTCSRYLCGWAWGRAPPTPSPTAPPTHEARNSHAPRHPGRPPTPARHPRRALPVLSRCRAPPSATARLFSDGAGASRFELPSLHCTCLGRRLLRVSASELLFACAAGWRLPSPLRARDASVAASPLPLASSALPSERRVLRAGRGRLRRGAPGGGLGMRLLSRD